jgi:hypothetical protein
VAMLTTTSFEALARMQMRALGDDELDLIVVAHPIGGINRATLEQRYEEAVPQALDWFAREAGRRSA